MQNLDGTITIAKPDGTPTEFFMQLLQDRGIFQDTDRARITALEGRKINTTAPLAGGGDLTADRTLTLQNSGVIASTYGDGTHVPQITVDAHGIVTAATTVAISPPGSTLIVKDEGTTLTAGATSLDFVGAGVTATVVGTAVTITIPSWTPTTRQVIAGTGLSGGGDLSANRTISLANTGVTPGTYTFATVVVDAQGRITSAASGTVPAQQIWAPASGGTPSVPNVIFDGVGQVVMVRIV